MELSLLRTAADVWYTCGERETLKKQREGKERFTMDADKEQTEPTPARDALLNELGDDSSEGRPDRPTLPLVGSMNVPCPKNEDSDNG